VSTIDARRQRSFSFSYSFSYSSTGAASRGDREVGWACSCRVGLIRIVFERLDEIRARIHENENENENESESECECECECDRSG